MINISWFIYFKENETYILEYYLLICWSSKSLSLSLSLSLYIYIIDLNDNETRLYLEVLFIRFFVK